MVVGGAERAARPALCLARGRTSADEDLRQIGKLERPGRRKRADAVEQLGPLVLGQPRDEADRGGAGDEPVRVHQLQVRERPLLDVGEQRGCERLAGGVTTPSRDRPRPCTAGSSSAYAWCSGCDSSRTFQISATPPRGRRTRLQLGQCAIGIEPVERLRSRNGVGDSRRRAGSTRPSPSTTSASTTRSKTVSHLGDRLDACHAQAARDELPRELARARTDVDDVRTRLELEHLDDVVERVRRVVGARLLVHLGRRSKPRAVGWMLNTRPCARRPRGSSSAGSSRRARSTSSPGSRSRAARGRRT